MRTIFEVNCPYCTGFHRIRVDNTPPRMNPIDPHPGELYWTVTCTAQPFNHTRYGVNADMDIVTVLS